MSVQLFSEEGLPDTAVKARKRPFMTAIAIVSHLKKKGGGGEVFHFACLSCHIKSYCIQSVLGMCGEVCLACNLLFLSSLRMWHL